MNQNGLNDTKAEDKLVSELTRAMMAGDQSKVDELMEGTNPPPGDETPPADENTDATNTDADGDQGESAQSDDQSSDQSNPPAEDEGKNDAAPDTKAELAAIKARLDAATNELHRYKSDAGRVPALQRRLVELERRLNPKKGDPAGTASTADVLDDESKQVLEKLRENDPVIADHLQTLLGKTVGTLRQQSEERQRQADQEEYDRLAEEAEQAEFNRLLGMAPYATQVFQSPEWTQWKNLLRPADKAYAESSSADEVYAALQWFGRDMQALSQQSQQAAPNPPVANDQQQSTAPKPAVAPKTKTNLAAQPNGRALSEDEMFAKVMAEVRQRDGLT